MSTKAIFCIVVADAPPDVIWHDIQISPYRAKGYDTISLCDSYDDFEHWSRIGIHELFFRTNPETIEEIDLLRLSNIIPDNAAELMVRWMDDYHTDRPKLHGNGYCFWAFGDNTRETQPKDAQQDTPEFRRDVLHFIHESIGKRLMVQVN